MVPQDLRHTREQTWAQVTAPNTVRTGGRRLGDAVFVQQPVPGARLAAGQTSGAVESAERVAVQAMATRQRAASYYTELTEQG